MLLWHCVWLPLLFGSLIVARKVKRKDGYRLNVPPPPQLPQHALQQGASHVPQPYQFETIDHNGFGPPHQHQHQLHPQHHHQQQQSGGGSHPQISSRYESDFVSLHHGSTSGSGGSFLVDNGLRSIAKGSADQANSAVASQNAAGKQAAYVAKSTLAQAAAQAAGTAVAALKGKEVLLHRLEEQNIETQQSVENELAQLQQAKRSAKAAQYAAQQAINHVSVLTAALNNAQTASELTQKSASEAAAELSSQIDMVAQAKAKLEQIESHLYAARLDYEETKEAAEKAAQSAQEAHINANDAAVHANVELSDSVHLHDKSDRSKSNK